MDISLFYEDNFDTIEWVNKILSEAQTEGVDNKEQCTASIVKKLQLYVQQVNSSLEDASQQVLLSLPRIMRDTRSLQQEALQLRDKMICVKEEISEVEQNTGQSMAMIERLDRLKTKLEDAKHSLHEADNWTLLANELEEGFESGNLDLISSKLLSMQHSLKILVNVADYEDRKLQLEELKNRLEAMTSPGIVQAFTSGNVEQSVTYAKTFASIGRTEQLLKYYHKCQKGSLLQRWRNQLEIEQDEPVSQWMHNFYDVLLSNWHAQLKWFSTVFPHQPVVSSLCSIYEDLLLSLDPSINYCIDVALKQQTDKLTLLLELKNITAQFGGNLKSLIDTHGGLPEDKIISLGRAIFGPFVSYVANYAAYEQGYLIQRLGGLNCVKDSYVDSVQSLGLSVPAVMDLGREAIQRCAQLTEQCGLSGLLIALKGFFGGYADQYRTALRQMERVGSGSDEDWSAFQTCLSMLQHVGDIMLQIQLMESDLTTSALDVRYWANVPYRELLLTEAGRGEYERLVKSIRDGREGPLLETVQSELRRLCSDIHQLTFRVVMAPITSQLEKVTEIGSAGQDGDVPLPDYGFAPHEYITQIGQYLMTLPQHLEPFLLVDNPALTAALRAADAQYGGNQLGEGEEESARLADVLLAIVTRGTCSSYCDTILKIRELRPNACRQLANDIDYLGSILEDLGLKLSETLQNLVTLLRLPAERYQSQSTGCPARLVAAIRQMRNITST